MGQPPNHQSKEKIRGKLTSDRLRGSSFYSRDMWAGSPEDGGFEREGLGQTSGLLGLVEPPLPKSGLLNKKARAGSGSRGLVSEVHLLGGIHGDREDARGLV